MEDKLQTSIEKAKELLSQFKSLTNDDFWLLTRKEKKVAYIIKHNGCLKIAKEKGITLIPNNFEIIKKETNDIVIGYRDDRLDSGFEVGEASVNNCKNDYPWAMALKRCQDRVILKLAGLAVEGVYSEEEADEFKKQNEEVNSFNLHNETTFQECLYKIEDILKTIDDYSDENINKNERYVKITKYLEKHSKEYFKKAQDILEGFRAFNKGV